jgi:putative Holliday junction resolvase
MTEPVTKAQQPGPILALDLGDKRVGVAISDALLISVRRLDYFRRSNWKQLLLDVADLVQRFDAQALVIGLPLNFDGSFGSAAEKATRDARKFARSFKIPVFLEDERLTSVEAEANLRIEGRKGPELTSLIDSESAAVILRDFIAHGGRRIDISTDENATAELESQADNLRKR